MTVSKPTDGKVDNVANGTTIGKAAFLGNINATDDGIFSLHGVGMQYRFHVSDGELVHDHFGAPAPARHQPVDLSADREGWALMLGDVAREWPDAGRGDFRLPAIHIQHAAGHCVSAFKYVSHEVVAGKPAIPGLPSTWGCDNEVNTLLVHMADTDANLLAELRYSIFPANNAITRSFSITNNSQQTVQIQRATSFSIDLLGTQWELVQLTGEWGREMRQTRHPVHLGVQGFQSSTGYAGHHFNPFVAMVSPETTEHHGPAYGFSLVWSGSFSFEVEQHSTNRVRVLAGLNPLQLSYPLAPGETFHSPEGVAVYSADGLGGMSQHLHRLYRDHLCRSRWVHEPRPTLMNIWEGMYYDFDARDVYARAQSAAGFGVKLLVMDDGWFGVRYPRVNDDAGLGDWVPNPARFPKGLPKLITDVTAIDVTTKSNPTKLKFGLWIEPEMVNPVSELYEAHPDWVLHAGNRPRTLRRNQLVLDLSKVEVQDHIISAVQAVLSSGDISYVKWDNNRAMHELPSPATAYRYILGLYRVLDTLTNKFPDVLFEGCASGGGRFDPGLLHYWPQHWVSDDTDGLERLRSQWGCTLAYPASAMGCHVSSGDQQVGRTTPLQFRATVAMMGGSFGFEFDLALLNEDERASIPAMIGLAEKVNPYVVGGDQFRLADPASNYPAVMYLARDRSKGVLLAFQIHARIRIDIPPIRFVGIEAAALYDVGGKVHAGTELLNFGLCLQWKVADYQSQVVWVTKLT